MINRVLIRIKVLQIVYACYQKENNDLKVAENELLLSLRRTYDLYYYFLLLIVEITNLEEKKVEQRKHKYCPTEAELNPSMRMVNNRFARQLETNETLRRYVKMHGISWTNEAEFVKKTLRIILSSDIYRDYISLSDDSYQADREFWRAAFRHLICGNESLDADMEDMSIYWNDDVEIIETFVIKTIKHFEESEGSRQELLPMFKDSGDHDFVVELFRHTMQNREAYRELIFRHADNWESDRIANMDLIIMQVALAEIMNFPTIPLRVTMNEYLDASKFYSTPRSSTFINGVLDSVIKELKKENLLLKD
jgi:N utilization substance protein B